MFYTIYKTTNLLDGKIYIGKHKTEDLNDTYLGSGKILSRSVKKHGKENFKKEILFVFETEEEMNAKEAELVSEEFINSDISYNLCPGGQGGWGYVNILGKNCNHNKNTKYRQKMSKIFSGSNHYFYGKLHSDKTKKKISDNKIKSQMGDNNPFYNKKHTEETKEKMRKSKNVGKLNSQFGTMWITNGIENKKIKKEDFIPEGWYKGRV